MSDCHKKLLILAGSRILLCLKVHHVVGIQDFMIIKELDLDWRKEVRSWKKITSGELKEVRPRIGQRKVEKDTTSPTRIT